MQKTAEKRRHVSKGKGFTFDDGTNFLERKKWSLSEIIEVRFCFCCSCLLFVGFVVCWVCCCYFCFCCSCLLFVVVVDVVVVVAVEIVVVVVVVVVVAVEIMKYHPFKMRWWLLSTLKYSLLYNGCENIKKKFSSGRAEGLLRMFDP